MAGKAERAAARAAVAVYHEARPSELLTHVSNALDQYRRGDPDSFEVDRVLFQYSRAANELWKFCNTAPPESTAELIRDGSAIDWWMRGAFKTK